MNVSALQALKSKIIFVMAEFKLSDAIDLSIVSKLQQINTELQSLDAQFSSTAQHYAELAQKMAQGMGVKPSDLDGLVQKMSAYEKNQEELIATQAQLNRLQQEHAALLKKAQTEQSEAVRIARERAAVVKAENEATQAQLRTKQEEIKLQKLQYKQGAEIRLSKERIIEIMKREAKTINEANDMNKRLRAAVKDLNVENADEKKLLDEINAKISQNTDFIKKNSDAYTQQKMNVGNYAESIKSAFSDIASGNVTLSSLSTMAQKTGEVFKGGLANGIKEVTKSFVTLLANPIVATLAAVASVIIVVKKAIESDNDALQQWQRILAPLKGVLQLVQNAVQGLAEYVLSLAEGFTQGAMAVAKFMEKLPLIGNGMKSVNKSIEDNVKATKQQQAVEEKRRDMIGRNAEINKRVAELNRKAAQTESVSAKERAAALKEIDRLEKQRMENNINIAKLEAEAYRLQHANSKNTREELDEQARLDAAAIDAETEYLRATQKSTKKLDAISKERSTNAEKEKTYRLKLQQLENEATEALTTKGIQQELAAIRAGYAKKFAEIKGNSEQEAALRIRLQQAMDKEINDKTTQHYYENATEIAELRKAVSKERSDEELAAELEILQLKYEQEIIAAQNNAEKILLITEKYEKEQQKVLEAATDERIKKSEQEATLRASYMTASLNEEINAIKQAYSRREITDEQMNAKIAEAQSRYAVKTAQASVDSLETILDAENISAEEREQLAARLADAKIALSNAETDAIIANQKRQEEAERKSIEKAMDHVGFAGDALNGFAELGATLYDNQLAKLDEAQEALDKAFDAETKRIDELATNGSISTEEAEARKRAAKDRTEKQAEEIQKKQDELQKRQARLAKANAIAQCIINTSLAIMKTIAQLGFPAAIPFVAMAGTLGAIQLANIAATPIAAYKEGTDDHKGGLAVVGDGGKREVVMIGNKAYITPDTPTLVDLPRHAKVLPDAEALKLDRIGSDLTSIMSEREQNGLPAVVVSNDFSRLEVRLDSVVNEMEMLRRMQAKNYRAASMSNFINERIK